MGTTTLVRDGDLRTRTTPATPAPATMPLPPIETPPQRENPAEKQRRQLAAGGVALPRRLVYAAFHRLPARAQQLAVRLGAAKVTYGACAVIQDSRGRVLLAHHTYRRRAWGLPGGLIRRGEHPYEAIERELREELGVWAEVGPLLYAETCLPARHLTLYYRATMRGAPHEDGVELDSIHYAQLDEALALLGPEARPWLDSLCAKRAS